MTAPSLAASLAVAAAFAVAGLAFGCAYFATLRRTAELLAGGHRRVLPAALTLGRLLAAIIFLGLAARVGALPLLTGLLGFLLARSLALRAVRRAA